MPDGDHSNCCITFSTGDTVRVRVDLATKCISFAVNEDGFVELSTIHCSETPYFLAIAMYNKGYKLRLLRHSVSTSHVQEDEVKENENEIKEADEQVVGPSVFDSFLLKVQLFIFGAATFGVRRIVAGEAGR